MRSAALKQGWIALCDRINLPFASSNTTVQHLAQT
jgi:hypothetical protein